MSDFQDKTAVVTGAGRGVGQEVARQLAENGARLALLARSSEQLEQTARLVKDAGATALVVPVDLTDRAERAAAIRTVPAEYGAVDILVNNAGMTTPIGPAVGDVSRISQVTNSNIAADARPGKRERLVAAARSAWHERGVERTTIADIAESADVPVGNVYYYFKTKNELVAATLDGYKAVYREWVSALERRRTPKARLHGLVQTWVNQRENLTAHGCPIGTLATELNKGANELAHESAEIFTMLLDWIETQFRDMGRNDARELAIALLSGYEGVAVLANTLGDQELIVTEGKRLERWIDSLA